jgi:hypothetical protein
MLASWIMNYTGSYADFLHDSGPIGEVAIGARILRNCAKVGQRAL